MGNDKNCRKFNCKDLYTIPNILTYIRILLIAPFAYYFLNENYLPATICIGFSGLSDCLDGFIARKFNQVTALGKVLDPIADKLTLLVVVICMVAYVPVVLPVLIVLLLKDLAMLAGGTDLIKKGIAPPAAKWYGKVGTILFYVSVCIIVFIKAVFNQDFYVLDFVLLTLTAIAMLFALYKYGIMYFQLIKDYKQKQLNVNDMKKQ